MKSKGYKPKKEFTLKQKIIGTLLMLLLYRFLSYIPLPFVDSSYIKNLIDVNGSLGLLNVMTGGGLGNMSLMALGISPWITASIVLQLIGLAFPQFADLQNDEDGRRRYKLITLGTTIVLALMESVGLMNGYGKAGYLSTYTWYSVLIISLLMMLGTGILSLMGWYIDEKLFGNGTSLILAAGILSSYVGDAVSVGNVLVYGHSIPAGVIFCVIAAVLLILLFAYTVFISSCEKRVRVTYSGKLSQSGNVKNTNEIPLKMLVGGVVPVVFASTIITFPALVGTAFGSDAAWLGMFNTSRWLHAGYTWQNIGFAIYIALIIAFGYFCQILYVNPTELARKLQKNGGTVPGVRPGKPTADYITSQLKWLTALGGIFLCVIAALPMVVSGLIGLSSLSFLGTSILIVVSTIKDTWDLWKTSRLSAQYSSRSVLTKGIL